MSCDKKQKS